MEIQYLNFDKKNITIKLNIKKTFIYEHILTIYYKNKNIGFINLEYIPHSFYENYVYNKYSIINFINDFICETGINTLNSTINDIIFDNFCLKYGVDNINKDIEDININLISIFQIDLDNILCKIDKFFIKNIYIDKFYRKRGFGLFLFELAAYYAYKNENRLYSDPEKRVTNFMWRKFETQEEYDFCIDDSNLHSIIKNKKPKLK